MPKTELPFIAEMNGYVSGVVSGEIVACKSVVGACQRHLNDLAKADQDTEYPFYFDAEHANKVCKFFPTLIKHSIGKHVGQPFKLQPWQAFAIASLFGWKKKKDGTRRFNKAYISVARKNGKSSLAAAICLFAAGFDINPITGSAESVAQVVIAASKKEQAEKVTMAECVRMRGGSPELKKRSKYQNRQITFPHNYGSICAIGSDRPFDGLNGSLVLVDELHAFRNTGQQVEFLDTMKTGSGARAQPLFIITTTAGSDNSDLWIEEYRYATGVAREEFVDDTYFSLSYELDDDDDPLDEDLWIKANPCIDVTVPKEYLIEQAAPAKKTLRALNRFKRYHCNQLVSALEGAFDMDEWKAAKAKLTPDWRKKADCIGTGVDLGGRNDMAAFAQVARFRTRERDDEGNVVYRYEATARAYISQDCKRDLTVEPIASFIRSGHLVVCQHPISELESDLIRDAKNVGSYEVAFDPYQAQATGEFCRQNGMNPVSMPQNYSHFTTPIEELRAALSEKRFAHDGNPLLQWCIGNAIVEEDRQCRLMLNKKESSEKIDPAVAMVMAFSRAFHGKGRAGSFLVY